MPNAPVFMSAGVLRNVAAATALRPAAAATVAASPATRMTTTTLAEARLARPEPVTRLNPILAREMVKIRPPVVDVIGVGVQGETRDKMTVPVCPVPELSLIHISSPRD